MSTTSLPPRPSQLFGVGINNLELPELLDFIGAALADGTRSIVANVNIYALNLAYELPRMRQFLNEADIVFCDGVGVQLGARLVGATVPYRHTPPDWLPRLFEECAEKGYSVYLLGAEPGIAEIAAAKILKQQPNLEIAGTHHGYFDMSADSQENRQLIEVINEVQPDLLIVGFGMPKQEFWLMENWPALEAAVALPSGAVIDYLAGHIFRAPRWITDNGLEWLARLVVEPGRLWRRYLVGNPLFFWRCLRQRVGL